MQQSSTQEIKDRLSIAEVVGGYVKLERAGKSLRARCPFHKERTASFYVSPERGTYYCFGCGEKGDVFSFVQKIDGLEFIDALKMLAERAGVELKEYQGTAGPSRDERERLYELHEEATRYFTHTLIEKKEIGEYLRGRGLTQETIEKWRLGYAKPEWRGLTEYARGKGFTDAELVASGLAIKAEKSGETAVYDRFRGRIMFPMSDVGGRVIAFSGRYFEKMEGSKEEEPAKYVNSPETPLFRKSKVLYGLDRAKASMRRHDFAILVEGQMDLLMMHQCGFPSAVAGSGTALTDEHLKAISHLAKRLVLALDSDVAGQKSALRASMLAFAQGFDVRVAAFPAGQDPADVGKTDPEALRKAVREAQTAVEFFLARARLAGRDERAVRRLAEADVLPLVAAMESAIDRAHFIQVVSRALDLPEESVRAGVAAAQRTQRSGVTEVVANAAQLEPESLPKLLHASALIILSAHDDSIGKLIQLLPPEDLAEAQALAEGEREKLLFAIERDGGAIDPSEMLVAVENELRAREVEQTRRKLKEAEARGDAAESEVLAKELQALSRQKHGM